MTNLRRAVALGDHPAARIARRAYRASLRFHVPVPPLVGPVLGAALRAGRSLYYNTFRLLIAEPLLRAQCASYGRNLRAGQFIPWIAGARGEVHFGNDCVVAGKVSVWFGARFAERPALIIGDDSGIGHDCQFIVAKRITIGRHCHIAGGTRMFDSNGHPLDPVKRLAGEPPDDEDVKPIVIGDNVWVGGFCTIFPGVTIGDNSVVATGSVVTSDVPPGTLVAGYPARQIKRFT